MRRPCCCWWRCGWCPAGNDEIFSGFLRRGRLAVDLDQHRSLPACRPTSSPGWVCRPAAAPGGISAIACTTSRPGADKSARWSSVRLNAGCCAAAATVTATSAAAVAAARTRLIVIDPSAESLVWSYLVCQSLLLQRDRPRCSPDDFVSGCALSWARFLHLARNGYAAGVRGLHGAAAWIQAPPLDYYDVLQVSPSAEPDTIHRVYRLLAQRFHPDNKETGNPAPLSRDRRSVRGPRRCREARPLRHRPRSPAEGAVAPCRDRLERRP